MRKGRMRLDVKKYIIMILMFFNCIVAYAQNIEWKSMKYGIFYNAATVNVNASIFKLPKIELYPHGNNDVLSLGDYYGLFLAIPVKDSLDLLFSMGLRVAFINNVSTFYFDGYNIGNKQPYTTKIKNTFEWFSITPLIQKELIFGVSGNFGLQINFPIIAESIFNDDLRQTHLHAKKTINTRLQFGLNYPISLQRHSPIIIVPEINILLPLNNDIGGDFVGRWTSNFFTIGMALQYDKENYQFTEKVREYEYNPITIDTIRRIAVNDTTYYKEGNITTDSVIWNRNDSLVFVNYVYNRTDTIYLPSNKVFEIDDIKVIAVNDTTNYTIDDNFKIEINEDYQNIQQIPILPYIFFDHNSSNLKYKYQKNKNKIKDSSEFKTSTKYDNENYNVIIATYYDILDIVGKRLQEHTDWSIKIIGCNDGISFEEKDNMDLSQSRANSVREYLHNIYSINYERMSIEARGLPNNPSLVESETYKQEENRRVEIVGNNDSLLLPVWDTILTKKTNFDSILLSSYIATNTDVKQYVIKLEFNDKIVTTVSYNYPTIINGGLDIKERLPLNYDSIDSDGTYKLTLLVINSLNQTKTQHIEIPVIYNDANTSKNINEEYDYLVLFNLKSADITDEKQIQMLNDISDMLYAKSTYKNYECSISGYTDIYGSNDFNQKLSQRRTENVKNILNFDAIILNKTEKNNLFDNATAEGRFYSRSVKIKIISS